MSFEEMFQPGMRHWREYQDRMRDRVQEAPAPGPGPMVVDLDKGIITINPEVDYDLEPITENRSME